jgi:hypothetical protein
MKAALLSQAIRQSMQDALYDGQDVVSMRRAYGADCPYRRNDARIRPESDYFCSSVSRCAGSDCRFSG